MSRFSEVRSALIADMVDAGELVCVGEDFYEDMGGHVSHESNLDGHINEYLKNLPADERLELIKRIGGIE